MNKPKKRGEAVSSFQQQKLISTRIASQQYLVMRNNAPGVTDTEGGREEEWCEGRGRLYIYSKAPKSNNYYLMAFNNVELME